MNNSRDPYVDGETGVLKNKLGLRTSSLLERFENDVVPGRILALRKQGFDIVSVFDIKKIHAFLFEPVFDWAGEIRTVTIYKSEPILEGASVDYTPAGYITKELMDLETQFLKIDWNTLSDKDKVSKAADIVQTLWQIHCFREGNTRVTALFMYFLLKKIGLHVNADFISKHSKYFRNALVLASCYSRSKPQYLKSIIADSVSINDSFGSSYSTLEGYQVEKYAYSYHTIEELKTIRSLQQIERDQKL